MLETAKRLLAPSARSEVPPFMVMDVMAAAGRIEAAGGKVIHMEVGQPAAPAPATSIAAARAALATGRLGYTETIGIPSLRARIARHYQESYGVAVDPGRVVVTTGSSAGFILAFLALFEPATGCGGGADICRTGTSSRRWAEAVDRDHGGYRCDHSRTADRGPSDTAQGVLIASPANPTGTMMTGELRDLQAAAEDASIRFSDEIYHGLDYRSRPQPPPGRRATP